MPTIQANGIQLYYEQHGWDNPGDVLVLSNGILMSTASWAYQTPVLSRHCRLLLYDCRGMWQSEHPPGPYSMEQHADDLAGLLDGLGVERAHIGGISYGAEVSMVFALRYPERTRSLILSSAVSQVDPLLRGMMDGWISAVRAKDADMLFEVTLPVNFSERWIAANPAALQAAASALPEPGHGRLPGAAVELFAARHHRRSAPDQRAGPGDGRRGGHPQAEEVRRDHRGSRSPTASS